MKVMCIRQFDDSSVRSIPLHQVLTTASYVVFYEMTRSSWHRLSRPAQSNCTAAPPPQHKPPTATVTSTSLTAVNRQPINHINGGGSFSASDKKVTFHRSSDTTAAAAAAALRPKLAAAAPAAVNKLGIVTGTLQKCHFNTYDMSALTQETIIWDASLLQHEFCVYNYY